MKILAKYSLAILGILGTAFPRFSIADDGRRAVIARWHDGKEAAVSLRFDDSMECHVVDAIPRLNRYGLKGTFMVNPGLPRYLRNRDFWENQVPAMGHQMGNHTMHHHGAKTPVEADYEIGETSRLLWKLYPGKSRLMVFASGGGGKKWGGVPWSQASEEYKSLIKKYHLIDLYDGKHPGLGIGSRCGYKELVPRVQAAVERGDHLPIIFHSIGTPGWKDRISALVRGYDLNMSSEEFDRTLRFLVSMKDKVWIAPLGDVLKYEAERNQSQVYLKSQDRGSVVAMLNVGTDPVYYDQELSIVIPLASGIKAVSVSQGSNHSVGFHNGNGSVFVDAAPVSGEIHIKLASSSLTRNSK